MNNSICTTKRRLGQVLGASVLLAGGIGASALFTAGTAEAATCVAPATCPATGTLTLGGGTMSLTAPSALVWAGTVTGLDQKLVDATTANQSYLVNDARGSGLGWHVTVSATTFTSGTNTLPVGSFSTNGSLTVPTSTNVPTAACSTLGDCTLPTNNTTFPVGITTAATAPTAFSVYNAAVGSGLGSITIGIGTNPVGWWLDVPGNTQAGTYASTITLAVVTAP